MTTLAIFFSLIKTISVEPILFLQSLSVAFHSTVSRYAIYQVICVQVAGVSCSELGTNATFDNGTGKNMENEVQKAAADFGTYSALAYMIPAVIADILLGALGDRYGRKFNILLGIFGTLLAIVPAPIVYKYPKTTPLYILIIANVVSGLTGFVSIVLISSFAYLADTVIDKDMLTIRMAVLQCMINVGQIVGPLIASAVSTLMESAYQEVMSIFLLLSTLLLGFVLLRHAPPAVLRARMMEEKKEKEIKNQQNGHQVVEIQVIDILSDENRDRTQEKPINQKIDTIAQNNFFNQEKLESPTASPIAKNGPYVCTEIWHLLKDTWSTYARPRKGHSRAYLFVISIIFFATFTAELGLRYGVLSLYVQKAPLRWNQAMLGYYDSCHGAAITVGTLIGILILKKWFHLSDIALIMISFLSQTGEMLLFAFAPSTWMIFLSTILGSLANLVKPCSKSFVAKLVDADEVGKAYTVFGIAQNVAYIISNILYNNLYKATLDVFPGTVFLFAAGISLLAFILVLVMYIDNRKGSNEEL